MRAGESGTAVFEIVIVGFVTLAIAMPVFVAVMSLAEARGDVATAATDAAAWYARHGRQLPDHDAAIDLMYSRDTDRVTVEASTSVSIVSVFGRSVDVSVRHRASAVVSPYRSDRDR